MNIFYLHENPQICAQMHIDKHCVKMIIEYAQLMSSAHRMLDGLEYEGSTKAGRKIKRYLMPNIEKEQTLYKVSHINHPSAVWARESKENYYWLYQMWCCLCDEYTFRYGKIHLTDKKLRRALKSYPENISDTPFTQPPQAMPDDVKVVNDSIQAYRNYYINYKKGFASWKVREVPIWFQAAQ